jgi:alpha-L-rhamnosidase
MGNWAKLNRCSQGFRGFDFAILRVCLVITVFTSIAFSVPAEKQSIGAAFYDAWHQAQWIWQAEDGPANTWVAFRQVFDLEQIPEKAIANIATDTKYWLWINGELVLFEGGLARGPMPNGSYFDQVEIGPFLKTGTNTVAILVWYWGKTAKTHEDSGKGGLLFSADLGETVVNSDQSWKMKVHPAYDPNSEGLHRSANRPQRHGC